MLATSVNVTRSPGLRLAILDGSFQFLTCPSCGHGFSAQLPFVYMDFDRGQFFGVFSPADAREWARREQETDGLFRRTLTESDHGFARDLAADMEVRTVFGIAALREKLLVWDAGLDDGVVEALKLEILLASDRQQVLRLARIESDRLVFAATTEDPEVVEVPRRRYDALADTDEARTICTVLEENSFRDATRLLTASS